MIQKMPTATVGWEAGTKQDKWYYTCTKTTVSTSAIPIPHHHHVLSTNDFMLEQCLWNRQQCGHLLHPPFLWVPEAVLCLHPDSQFHSQTPRTLISQGMDVDPTVLSCPLSVALPSLATAQLPTHIHVHTRQVKITNSQHYSFCTSAWANVHVPWSI